MNFLFVLATISGALMGAANFPQAIKIFQTKRARDISIITYLILTLGAFIWVIYGFNIKNIAIITTNSIGFIALSLVVIGWFLYGRENKRKKSK